MKSLQIVTIKNPLLKTHDEPKCVDFRGESLADLVEMNVPKDVEVTVTLNGGIIPKNQWVNVIPTKGQFIVIIPVLSGGDSGKQILNGIAMIAIMVIAVVTGQYWLMLEGWKLMAFVAVVSMAGGMAVQALTPKPSADNSIDKSFGASQAYGWSPQTTQQQGIYLPMVYGKVKVHGNIISAFSEPMQNNNQQIINFLVSLGLGPIKSISDIKINKQAIENYTDVTYETKTGELNQSATDNFDQTKVEFSVNVAVTFDNPHEYTTINSDFDALEVDVIFPQGIYKFTQAGNPGIWNIRMAVDYRKLGDGEWTRLFAGQEKTITQVRRQSKGGIKNLKIWTQKRHYYVVGDSVMVTGLAGLGGVNGNTYSVNKVMSNKTFLVDVDLEGSGITGLAELEALKDTWEEGYAAEMSDFVGDGVVSSEVDQVTDRRASRIARTYKITDALLTDGNKYEIKITKLTEEKYKTGRHLKLSDEVPDARFGQIVNFSVVREVMNDSFQYPRQVLVGVRALATDQISGAIDFSCVLEGRYVRTYSDTKTYWGVEYSTNPAWILYDVLTQPVYSGSTSYAPSNNPPSGNEFIVERYDGIDPSKIDTATFLALADYCDELVGESGNQTKRITFNGMFTNPENLWASAQKVCEIARCALVWNGSKIFVAIDKITAVSSLYNVSNMVKSSFKEFFIPLVDRANEFQISILDEDRDWERTPLSILNTSSTDSVRSIEIDLFGITNQIEAWRAGMFRLRQNQYLIRMLEFELSIEAIACMIGDVIIIQHDIPRWNEGGRVVSATSTSLLIDKVLTPGSSMQVMVRTSDDVLQTQDVSMLRLDGREIMVLDEFDPIPQADDNFIYGSTSTIEKEYRVLSLSRSSDLNVKVRCIEYNESIYDDDDLSASTAITIPFSNIDILVTNLTLIEIATVDESGSIQRSIDVNYVLPQSDRWQRAEIYYKPDEASTWEKAGDSLGTQYIIPNVLAGETYDVTVLSVDGVGKKTAFQDAPVATITMGGGTPYGGETLDVRVTGLALEGGGNEEEFTGRDIRFVWNPIQITADSDIGAGEEPGGAGATVPNNWLRDYQVKIKDNSGATRRTRYTEEAWFVYTYEMNSEDGSGTPSRNITIEVKARDTFGRLSAIPAVLSVTNPVPSAVSNITLSPYYERIILDWDAAVDLDLAGYIVWSDTSSPLAPTSDKIVYKGPETVFSFNVSTTAIQYFRIAAYDEFGTTGLNISAEYNDQAINAFSSYSWQAPEMDGIIFSISGATVSWTAGTIHYSGTDYPISSGNSTNSYFYYDFDDPGATFSTSATKAGIGNIGTGTTYDKWLFAIKEASDKLNVVTANQLYHAGFLQANAIKASVVDTTDLFVSNDVVIGNYGGGQGVFWNQSGGTLTISGSITLTNAGSTSLSTYNNNSGWTDDVAADAAQGTANTGVTNAAAAQSTANTGVTNAAAAQSTADGAATAASAAQSTADVRVSTFFQAGAPTANATGDIWFDTTANKIKRWNGANWTTEDAQLSAAAIATGILGVGIILGNTFVLNTSGQIYTSGKTGHADANTGIWLGYESGAYTFSVGSNTKYFRWNGTALTVGGDIIATGNIKALAVTTSTIGNNATSDFAVMNRQSDVTLTSASTWYEVAQLTFVTNNDVNTSQKVVFIEAYIQGNGGGSNWDMLIGKFTAAIDGGADSDLNYGSGTQYHEQRNSMDCTITGFGLHNVTGSSISFKYWLNASRANVFKYLNGRIMVMENAK